MSIDWESNFSVWGRPPSDTEEQRCENAISVVRNAIVRSDRLASRNIKVFAHGSYQNNTNVRQDSDVDIAIVCSDTFYYDLPDGCTDDSFGISPATYHYDQFKNAVGEALISYLGFNAVQRGKKVLDIHENTYHVDAEVAPFFEHRRYQPNGKYLSGVELHPDNGGRVINWPEQHYANGVSKNSSTHRRFKSIVRILKALCNAMADNNIDTARDVPGFLIECLVWNVPNDHFGNSALSADARNSLAFLFNNTMNDNDCNEWGEVSELKYLFRMSQKWTRKQAHSFISSAWDVCGLR